MPGPHRPLCPTFSLGSRGGPQHCRCRALPPKAVCLLSVLAHPGHSLARPISLGEEEGPWKSPISCLARWNFLKTLSNSLVKTKLLNYLLLGD